MNHPEIVYEDNHLLVCNKPPGWLVQGDRTGDRTLTDWGRAYIKEKFDKPGNVFIHPVHRLDRPVTGLVVFSRTSKSLERMTGLFRGKKISKSYLAIVDGKPEPETGELRHWIQKDPKKNVSKAYDHPGGSSKEAILKYELLAFDVRRSLVAVYPETGRPHQIRVQLSTIDCPIQGDLKYGCPTPNPDKSISLHAFKLEFLHPVKKEHLVLKCLPKTDSWGLFKNHIDELG